MENWKGRFASNHYSSYVAKGEVSIDLDNSKKPEEEYETTLHMLYTGLFMKGQKIIYNVTVKDNKIEIKEANITLKAVYKDTDLIRGTYSRSQPVDQGNFILHKIGTNGYNEIGVSQSDVSCIIL